MIYCPGCGTANREGSRFCNECGSPLVEEEAVACPRCGSNNAPGTAHCQECGLDLARLREGEEVGPEPAAGEELAPPEDEDEAAGSPTGQPDEAGAAGPRAQSLPPWLDSVELPAEEPAPRRTEAAGAEPEEEDLPHLPRDEWSADAIPIEPVVGVPYRARERPEQPLIPEQEEAAQLFADVAEEEVRASPRELPQPPGSPRLEAGLRRLAALALLLAVTAPLVWPLEPFAAEGTVSAPVAAAAKTISEVPPGATVLVAFEYDAGMAGDLQPIAEAYLHQLLGQKLRVLLVSIEPEGAALGEMALERVLPAHTGIRYGDAVLNLGYVAGGEVAVRGLATNLRGMIRTDHRYGRPLQEYALAAGVEGVRDLPLIVVLGRDLIAVQRWVEQVATPYGGRLVVGVPALVEPAVLPYQTAGQVRGVVAGLRGAAALERLQARRGSGGRMLGAVRTGAWIAGGLVVLANAGALLGRLRRRQQDEGTAYA